MEATAYRATLWSLAELVSALLLAQSLVPRAEPGCGRILEPAARPRSPRCKRRALALDRTGLSASQRLTPGLRAGRA